MSVKKDREGKRREDLLCLLVLSWTREADSYFPSYGGKEEGKKNGIPLRFAFVLPLLGGRPVVLFCFLLFACSVGCMAIMKGEGDGRKKLTLTFTFLTSFLFPPPRSHLPFLSPLRSTSSSRRPRLTPGQPPRSAPLSSPTNPSGPSAPVRSPLRSRLRRFTTLSENGSPRLSRRRSLTRSGSSTEEASTERTVWNLVRFSD